MTERPQKLMNRNFLLLWLGQSASQLGIQAYIIATVFWLKDTTDSASLMGLLQMLSSLPSVLLGPIGGAFVDRHSRRGVIVFSDLLRGASVLGLGGLLFVAPKALNPAIVSLFVVSILVNVTSSFFTPALYALGPDIVPRHKIVTANSLWQLGFQLAMFIGQAVGGTLYRLLGAPVLLFANGLTYLAAAGSALFIKEPALIKKLGARKNQLRQMKEDILQSFHYAWGQTGLRELVFLSAFLAFFATPIIMLLPFYVEDTLRVQPDWYGFMLSAYGVGSLVGYLFSGSIALSGKARGRVMLVFIILESLGHGVLGLLRNPIQATVAVFLGGFVSGFVAVNITTIMQITTPREMRGRLFGLLATLSGGLTPIAMGLSGIITDLVNQNIPLVYMGCGGVMTILSLIVTLNGDFRQFLARDQREISIRLTIEEQIAVGN